MLFPLVKDLCGGKKVIADLGAQTGGMNLAKGYGQQLSCYCVDHCVVPGKLVLEIFKITWFCGGSDKHVLVVAGDIYS